jgi:LysM repeat protein
MYHIVRRGETLHSIASNYRTSVRRLINLNPCVSNPNLIYPGERIRVR